MSEVTTPRGTPEEYREFVRQMELGAKRNSARKKALAWRNVSMEERARALCDLMDMGSRIVRHTGYRKRPLNYPRLPEVRWADRPATVGEQDERVKEFDTHLAEALAADAEDVPSDDE